MIPDLVDIGGIWEVLPPGIHEATLYEVEQRYAYNVRRLGLFDGFKRGLLRLAAAGCKLVYLDGSFVTSKTLPGDFDAGWDPVGMDLLKLDPVLLTFDNKRALQKATFGGEFFPSNELANGVLTFLEYFQLDKDTGNPKGIIGIRLS
jgi:hypothetical protein